MQQDNNKKTSAENGKDKGHQTNRKHGYFISPPAATKNNIEATQNNQNDKQPSPKHNNNKNNIAKHQKNDHNKNDRKKKSDEQRSVVTSYTENVVREQADNTNQNTKAALEKLQNSNTSEQKSNDSVPKKKNNRNKNRNKNKNNAQKQTDNSSKQKNALEDTHKSTESQRVPQRDNKSANIISSDDYEEYNLVADDSQEVVNKNPTAVDNPDAPKTEVVGIRFKSSGKVYYFDPQGRIFKHGSNVIVDTARGQEFGEVAISNTYVKTADIVPPLRAVVRGATTADIEHHKSNKKKEEEAYKLCNEKIALHGLEMKLIDAQYTFDNSKLLFYFTSSERVDFRELVKDLASVFRTRIELRQIGIRDEAKLMGGLGMCGRPLCCTLFLSDFDQVSIKMAKEQNLSLNSAKISGICGRLMCCLKYEHEAYEYEIKRTPPVDSLVRTENGDGIVTEISPLQGTIKVRLLATPEIPPKTYKRDDVTMLRKKKSADNK